MKNKDWIIIALCVLILILGIGLVWTMQTTRNSSSSNNTNQIQTPDNSVNVQKTPQASTNTQSQVTDTQKTNIQTEAQSEYVILTCEVCGKQFQSPRNGPQLRICDQCVNTPEAQKLLQEAGY